MKYESGMDFGRKVRDALTSAGLVTYADYDLRIKVSGTQSSKIKNINVQLFDRRVTNIDAATKLLKRKFGHLNYVKNATRPEVGQFYGTGNKLPVVRIQFSKAVLG